MCSACLSRKASRTQLGETEDSLSGHTPSSLFSGLCILPCSKGRALPSSHQRRQLSLPPSQGYSGQNTLSSSAGKPTVGLLLLPVAPRRHLSSFWTISTFLTYFGEVVSTLASVCLLHFRAGTSETPAHADTGDSLVLRRDSCRDMQFSLFLNYASGAPRNPAQEGNVQTL